jgi:signal transduction histidine kinase
VPDIEADGDYICFDPRTRSELAVPIILGGVVIGVINVEHSRKHVFSEEDRQALEMLSSNVSIAIQNARTFEELKTTKLNVESLVNLAWAGTVASAWRHSIGNHAVIVSDIVKLIRDDLDRGGSVAAIDGQLTHIENVISEIQSIPMLPLSTEDGVESVLVNQLIAERLRQYGQKKGRFAEIIYNAELTGDSSTTVRASREWLRRLLDILIDNAVNAMVKSQNKILTIRSEVENFLIKISVVDSGSGIPPEVRHKLLQTPIMKKIGEKGSGVGLYLGREITKTYGGRLEIGPSDQNGTTMIAWFPVEKII